MEKETLEGVDQLGGWAWGVKTWSWKDSPGPSSGATQDKSTPSGGGGLALPRMSRPLHVQDQSALRSSCQPPSPVSRVCFDLPSLTPQANSSQLSGSCNPSVRPSQSSSGTVLAWQPHPLGGRLADTWGLRSDTSRCGDSGPGQGWYTLRIIMCLPGSVS